MADTWATHEVACPVCQVERATLDLATGAFHPGLACHGDGWRLTRHQRHRLRSWFMAIHKKRKKRKKR